MKKIIRISNPDNSVSYVVTPDGQGVGHGVPFSKIEVAPESMGLHRIFYDKDESELEKIRRELLGVIPATSILSIEVIDLCNEPELEKIIKERLEKIPGASKAGIKVYRPLI